MRHIVGIADMKVSAERGDLIVTHALGSCLGIAIHDPVACVGGLLHVMLPLSSTDPAKAKENPYMFVDTGVPRLFHACYKAGAQKQRLLVKVAGGACTNGNGEEDFFQIGKRNFAVLRELLWKNGVLLKAHDVGGSHSRTMALEIGRGEVTLQRCTWDWSRAGLICCYSSSAMRRSIAKGLLAMRERGAYTLAQAEASCVVFGMPREAIALGAVDKVVGLDEIPATVIRLLAAA